MPALPNGPGDTVTDDNITEERMKALITALEQERRGYAARGLADRVRLVDAEIMRLGGAAAMNVERRPRRAATTRKGG